MGSFVEITLYPLESCRKINTVGISGVPDCLYPAAERMYASQRREDQTAGPGIYGSGRGEDTGKQLSKAKRKNRSRLPIRTMRTCISVSDTGSRRRGDTALR